MSPTPTLEAADNPDYAEADARARTDAEDRADAADLMRAIRDRQVSR